MFSTLCLYTRDQKNTKNEMIWTRSERKYQNTWVKKNLNSPFPKITDRACWLNHRPFNFRAKMLRSLPVRLWTSRGKENKPLFTVCYLFIALRSNIFILLLWNFDSENLNICDVFFIHSARGSWSHKGCRVVKEKDQNVECACDHLTNFAILMQVKEFEVCSLFSVCNDSLEYKKSES